MTTLSSLHPSLDLAVTEPQRERCVDYLQRAYGEGRLTEVELDQRIETVLRAGTRREMNRAFDGLARIPVGTGATVVWQSRPAGTPTVFGRTGAALAHLSALGTWAVGPAVAYALAPQGSYLRREAAKAFNFQVVAALVAALVVVVLGGNLEGMAMGVGAMGWFLLNLVGAARAAAGEQWHNPVTRAVPVRLLDEGPRPGRRRELTR